jgi:hypothetical protein
MAVYNSTGGLAGGFSFVQVVPSQTQVALPLLSEVNRMVWWLASS